MKANKAPPGINEKDLLEERFFMFCFFKLAGERNSYVPLFKKPPYFLPISLLFLKNITPFCNILHKLPHFTFLDGKLHDFFKKLGQLSEMRLTFRFDTPIFG
jgi:hypothetical protein